MGILIRGGIVVDGTGATPRQADVRVADQNFWSNDGFGSFFQPNPQPGPPTGNTRGRGGQYYQQPQPRWW